MDSKSGCGDESSWMVPFVIVYGMLGAAVLAALLNITSSAWWLTYGGMLGSLSVGLMIHSMASMQRGGTDRPQPDPTVHVSNMRLQDFAGVMGLVLAGTIVMIALVLARPTSAPYLVPAGVGILVGGMGYRWVIENFEGQPAAVRVPVGAYVWGAVAVAGVAFVVGWLENLIVGEVIEPATSGLGGSWWGRVSEAVRRPVFWGMASLILLVNIVIGGVATYLQLGEKKRRKKS